MEDYDLFLSDEEIHGLEEDSEVVELRNEVGKLKEKLKNKEDTIKFIKEIIKHDIKVNERCLEEETSVKIVEILRLQVKYDNELLEIANEE